jgi:hypothetical protein
MRFMAFNELIKLIEDPLKIKQDSIRSQVDWVLNSMKKKDLIKLANVTLIEANKSYSELKEPNRIQISVKKRLDQIEGEKNLDNN